MKWQNIKWPVIFSIVCTAIVTTVLVGLWLTGVFGDMGLSIHGVIALLLGVTLTVFLGVGLMALVFHSGRSRHDELVRHDLPPGRDLRP
jgi:ABC-type multidrug transport system permease subunit